MNARLMVVAAGTGLVFVLSGCDANRSSDLANYEAGLRADAAQRAKDPAWKPSHKETAVIRVGGKASSGLLHNFCVNRNGNLLACWGGSTPPGSGTATRSEPTAIKVLSPAGEVLETWPLDFEPQAICVHPSGDIIVGGDGRLARLNPAGKVLHFAASPALAQPEMPDDELRALLKERRQPESELEQYKQSLQSRRKVITGLTASEEDVFIACSSPKGYSFAAYRVDGELKHPKLVVDKLSGCCSQMDLGVRDGKLWVAHNGRHRVECFDREGKKLASFGKTNRREADGFGGCCEPKNIRLAANGEVFAAESGPPVAIKRFTPEGKFLGVVAVPTFDTGCVRVTVDISPDGETFYLLDTGSDAIHAFVANKSGT